MKDLSVSLKEFHIVFITASILLSLGFATWGFVQYNELHDMIYVGASLLSVMAAMGLVIYEIFFIRKIKT